MRARHVVFLMMIAAISFAVTWGCSSGGSAGPGEPTGPGEFSLNYCGVIEVEGVMHVRWSSDVATRGEVRFGRETYTQLISVPAWADTHDVELAGLAFNTHYIYRILVHDSLNRTADCDGDFTTPIKASPEPIISNIRIVNITESAALITWRTDEPATTILYYGVGTASDSIVMASYNMDHGVQLATLVPSSTYRIRPEAVNAGHYRGIASDTTFVTAAQLMLAFPDTTVSVGDTVSLPITIRDAQNLAGLTLGMRFETGMVEVVGIEEGPFFAENRGFIFFSDIRNGDGFFAADLTWNIDYLNDMQVNTDADGAGIVAYARIRGLEMGEADLTFDPDSTFGLDMFANVRACSLAAGSVEVWP